MNLMMTYKIKQLKHIFLIFFLVACNLAHAQPDTNDSLSFREYMEANRKYEVNAVVKKGYKAFVSMGVLAGPAENVEATPYSVLVTNSYTFHEKINMGLLTGYELLNESTVPLGVNIRLTEPWENRVFYLGISSGYSISLEKPVNQNVDQASGGYFMNPEVGLVLPFSARNSFYMAIGFRYNELYYSREDPNLGNVERTIYFRRVSLKFGVVLY